MIQYMYHPYVKFAVVLLLAALVMADCEPDDLPDWGRY